jgi:RNA polymerase sigma-70 factor (ECF subfamily)
MSGATAFEAFVRKYQDMVFGTAVRLLGDESEAQDVAQTVFLKAFERFDQLGESPSAGGWLKTVTTNLCLNHLSRIRARWRLFSQRRSGESVTEPGYEERLVAQGSQDADLERAQEHARLERAIRRLRRHQRVPLVLFHFEERSYAEIAEMLGVSLGKVKSDIHRGRETLRKLMVTNDETL